jgi:hypothetical protein
LLDIGYEVAVEARRNYIAQYFLQKIGEVSVKQKLNMHI